MKKFLLICVGSLVSISANADMFLSTDDSNSLKKWHQASLERSLEPEVNLALTALNKLNQNTQASNHCDDADCDEKTSPCNFDSIEAHDKGVTDSKSKLDGITLAFEESLGAIELLFFDLVNKESEDPAPSLNETTCENMLISTDPLTDSNDANGSQVFKAFAPNNSFFNQQLGLLTAGVEGNNTGNDIVLTNTQIRAVPLPATTLLFSSALFGFMGAAYRKTKLKF